MWEQYKKTALSMQVIIVLVTAVTFWYGRQLGPAALLFATMQLAAFSGAMWGVRLKQKIERGRNLAARS